mgnify:FL=1
MVIFIKFVWDACLTTVPGFEPIWVDDVDVADDLINEFNLGIERASASELITIEGSVRAYPDTVLVKVTSPFNSCSFC